MNESSNHERSLRRLSLFYFAALGLIGLVLCGGEFWIQTEQGYRGIYSKLIEYFEDYRQTGIQLVRDAREVVASREAETHRTDLDNLVTLRKKFSETREFVRSGEIFEGLPDDTADELLAMSKKLEPHDANILAGIDALQRAEGAQSDTQSNLESLRATIQLRDSFVEFAAGLSRIVSVVQQRDAAQIQRVREIQLSRLLVSLILIILIGLLMFKPAIQQTRSAMDQLEKAGLEMAAARDEALDYSRFKSAFLANMSHEFRTPMNGMVGMIELLQKTKLTGQQREFIGTIETGTGTLLRIVEQILDISKIEAGKLTLENQELDLRKIVELATRPFTAVSKTKNLKFKVTVDQGVPPLLIGDPIRIAQIATNLLENAFKWTEHGEVSLRVTCQTKSHLEAEIFLIVKDTGSGLTERQLHRLFQPFIQADLSSTRRIGGTGLGLAIVNQLVSKMNGTIKVESKKGEGASFRVAVRLAIPPSLADSGVAPIHQLVDSRVLIAGDDRASRELICMQLATIGIRCVTVATPAETLAQIREMSAKNDPFELIVLDLQSLDSLSFARQLQSEIDSEKTRILLISSFMTEEELAKETAIDASLSKPIVQERLLPLVRSLLLGEKPSAPLTETKASEPEPEPTALPHAHILLVEDNPTNQAVTKLQLGEFGVDTDIAANGREAVERLGKSRYDLVLMDCQMPLMDGYQATRLIRRTEGPNHVPIIAMTAHAMRGDREKCLEAGMDDYIAKPVNEKTLRATLERWLLHNGATSSVPAPVMTLPTTAPTLDMGVFERIRSMATNQKGPGELVRLVHEFLQYTDFEIRAMHECLKAANLKGAAERAHSIRGSVGFYGALQLAPLCKEFQNELKDENIEEANRLFDSIRLEARRVRKAMEKEINVGDS